MSTAKRLCLTTALEWEAPDVRGCLLNPILAALPQHESPLPTILGFLYILAKAHSPQALNGAAVSLW